jgi:hypothetical protein
MYSHISINKKIKSRRKTKSDHSLITFVLNFLHQCLNICVSPFPFNWEAEQ